MIKPLLLIVTSLLICLTSGSSDVLKQPKAVPDCSANTFVIDVNQIRVEAVSILARFRLQLNATYATIPGFTFADYFEQCLDAMVLRANDHETRYRPRDTDNLNEYVTLRVDDLQPFVFHEVRTGFLLKNAPGLPVLTTAQTYRTCFGQPPRPVNLTLSTFLNGSYLIGWNPAPNSSPLPCYYKLFLKADNTNNELEVDVNGTQYYLRKETSRTPLNLRIFSVNDAICHRSTYPFVNDCVNQTLRSSSPTTARILPARDYINGGPGGVRAHVYLVFPLLITLVYYFTGF